MKIIHKYGVKERYNPFEMAMPKGIFYVENVKYDKHQSFIYYKKKLSAGIAAAYNLDYLGEVEYNDGEGGAGNGNLRN